MSKFHEKRNGAYRAGMMAFALFNPLCVLLAPVAYLPMLAGCSIEESAGTKVSSLVYEIVEDGQIPEELQSLIEENKAADFKLTYEAGDDLYIVRGYGEQETGGYSISIRECCLTTNAILFDTELIGPRKGETTCKGPSYPYIVIKTAKQGKNTIFE